MGERFLVTEILELAEFFWILTRLTRMVFMSWLEVDGRTRFESLAVEPRRETFSEPILVLDPILAKLPSL